MGSPRYRINTAYRPRAPASRRAAWARAVLGNVGLLAMFIGISELTPKRPVALYQTLRFIRYALVPVTWVS